MSTANTNQKEHTMPYEQFVTCPVPGLDAFVPAQFHVVPRSKSTIHEFTNGFLYAGDDPLRRVHVSIETPPEKLEQMAADALLLAEHLKELQAAVQAEKEAEKDAQRLEKEAQALFESINGVDWHYTTSTDKADYIKMARKAREIHGVSK